MAQVNRATMLIQFFLVADAAHQQSASSRLVKVGGRRRPAASLIAFSAATGISPSYLAARLTWREGVDHGRMFARQCFPTPKPSDRS
jgi:hypothetical protein